MFSKEDTYKCSGNDDGVIGEWGIYLIQVVAKGGQVG
jgi:hypothetical protein